MYEKRGDKILDKSWSFSLEDEGIDSYLVREFSKSHSNYKETIAYRGKWMKLYGNTKIKGKGFLKIKFKK